MISHRALTEAFKFLSLSEVLFIAVFVSKAWNSTTNSSELLLFFLESVDADLDDSLSPYAKLKQQELARRPRFLVRVGNYQTMIWDIHENAHRTMSLPSFVNTSRYTLDSKDTAIVTGGNKTPRGCARVHLATGTVTQLSGLLEDREQHGIAAIRNLVYVSGGVAALKDLKSAEMFDGVQWTKIVDMTTERSNVTLAVYHKKIYAFGGANHTGYQKSIEFYDRSVWTLAAFCLPSARINCSVAPYKGGLVLIGGYSPENSCSFVHVLDAGAASWRQVCESIPITMSLSNSIAVRNAKVYFFSEPASQVVIDVCLS